MEDFKLFKLENATHFQQWKFLVKSKLLTNNLRRSLFSGDLDIDFLPENLSDARQRKILKEDEEMRVILVGNVSTKVSSLILHKPSFSSMWKTLEEHFVGDTSLRLEEITGKLRRLKLRKDVTQLLTHFQTLVEEYRSLDGTHPPIELAKDLLRALPSTFDSVSLHIQREFRTNKSYTLENMVQEIRASNMDILSRKSSRNRFRSTKNTSEGRKKTTDRKKENGQRAFFTGRSEDENGEVNKSSEDPCQFCEHLDHTTSQCPLLQRAQERSQEDTFSSEQSQALDDTEPRQFIIYSNESSTFSSPKAVVFHSDSAADIHSTDDRSLLHNVRPCHYSVNLAKKDTSLVYNLQGDLKMYTDLGKLFIVKDVYYSSEGRNLLSSSLLLEDKYKATFSSAGSFLSFSNNKKNRQFGQKTASYIVPFAPCYGGG